MSWCNRLLFNFFFFSVLAFRVSNRQRYIKTVLVPILLATILVVLTSFIITLAVNSEKKVDCHNPIWISLSSITTTITTLLIIVEFIVLRYFKAARHSLFNLYQQKRLWILIIVFWLSSVVAFSWDLYLTIKSYNTPCENLIHSDTGESIFFWLILRITSVLVPIWAVLFVLFSMSTKRSVPKRSQVSPLTERLNETANNNNNEFNVLESWENDFTIDAETFHPISEQLRNFPRSVSSNWGSNEIPRPTQ